MGKKKKFLNEKKNAKKKKKKRGMQSQGSYCIWTTDGQRIKRVPSIVLGLQVQQPS